MAARRALPVSAVALLALLLLAATTASADSWLYEKFTTEGNVRADYNAQGQQVTSLILTPESGGAFRSRQRYLYGEFSIQMKQIRGNSAGTVTSFYLTSGDGPGHDEIDMEFMGNSSGDPVVLNTNVWANGDGKKEHQFYLWFDPAADYHTYTIIWNDKNVIFKVDDLFVRSFRRYPDLAYPGRQPMSVHARHALGRQLLGHAAREGEGGLGRRALQGRVPRLRRRRPPAGLPRRHRPLDEPPARRRRVGHRRLGQAELHALQLLRGRMAIPRGASPPSAPATDHLLLVAAPRPHKSIDPSIECPTISCFLFLIHSWCLLATLCS